MHLEHASRLSPNSPRYHVLLGEAYLLRGDAEDAIAPLQVGFQADAHPRTAYLLAIALLRCHRIDQAERYASAAVGETGSVFHRAHYVRATCRLARDDREGAIRDLWQALDLAPEESRYRMELARLLVARALAAAPLDRRRRVDEAVHVLREASPASSCDAEWHYLIACCLIEGGDAAEALGHLARTDFPSLEEVAFRRGLALARLDRADEAARELERSARDPALAARAHQILEQMRGETAGPLPSSESVEGAMAANSGGPDGPPPGAGAGLGRTFKVPLATPEVEPREEEASGALSEATFLIGSTEALELAGDPHTILDPVDSDPELPHERGEEEAAAS